MIDPTGMSCQELVELVTEYFEGTLAAEARERLEYHLSLCRPCRDYLEQMRLTVRTLGKLTEDSIPENAREQLLHAFRDWKRR